MTACYHCGLPADPRFSADISGQKESFCCPGCVAVASLIDSSGLGSFYRYRDRLPYAASTPTEVDLSVYDDPEYQQGFVEVLPSGMESARIQVLGMNCSACAWLIEKQLEKEPGVERARVNYSQRVLHLEWDGREQKLSEILALINKLGFEVVPDRPQERQSAQRKEGRELLMRMGIAGIGMMQVGMYAIAVYAGEIGGSFISESTRDLMRHASLFLATVVIFYSAQPFFLGAFHALKSRHLSMDVPVSLALALAYFSSLIATWRGTGEVYFDAISMFCFFLLISRYLEFRARSQWNNARDKRVAVDQAWLLETESESGEKPKAVASSSLREGQLILIKNAEALPVDGLLLDDMAELDQAQLTGEFTPQVKHKGDELSSGSINLGKPMQVQVLRTQDQSAMAQIESVVARAEMHKPKIAGLADQISGYFVGALLLLAATTYLYWLNREPDQAFWVSLSVLVVGCPCALSLATPASLTVLMRHLRTRGILVQTPQALEALSKINSVLFDKTGTLTRGEFRLDWVEDLSDRGKPWCLQQAALLESLSGHPLARAFANQDPVQSLMADWQLFDGKGIQASVNGQLMRIGTEDFVTELVGTALPEKPKAQVEKAQQVIYLGAADQWLAVFALSDHLRKEARPLITQLKKLGLNVGMLSGDPSGSVASIAAKLGITNWFKGMSAEDKYAQLKAYQAGGEHVLSVGDGINDAPFLSVADVSVALSDAVDMSKNKADFVLISNNLLAITELMENAHKARKVIAQNLSWALGYNLLAIPMAMMGLIPPWLAAIGMSLSSALVVLNALRARVTTESVTDSERLEVQPC